MTVKITFAGSSRSTWSRPSIYGNFLRLAHAESFPELIRSHHACRKLNKKKSFKRHADSFHPVLGWNISYRYIHTKTHTHKNAINQFRVHQIKHAPSSPIGTFQSLCHSTRVIVCGTPPSCTPHTSWHAAMRRKSSTNSRRNKASSDI